MSQTLLWLAIAGMGALWFAVCAFTIRQSRLGVQLVFLLGMLMAWPALTFALGAEMFAVIFPPDQSKPVGPGGVIVFFLAGGLALVTWLLGFWLARMVGWLVRRKHVEA